MNGITTFHPAIISTMPSPPDHCLLSSSSVRSMMSLCRRCRRRWLHVILSLITSLVFLTLCVGVSPFTSLITSSLASYSLIKLFRSLISPSYSSLVDSLNTHRFHWSLSESTACHLSLRLRDDSPVCLRSCWSLTVLPTCLRSCRPIAGRADHVDRSSLSHKQVMSPPCLRLKCCHRCSLSMSHSERSSLLLRYHYVVIVLCFVSVTW